MSRFFPFHIDNLAISLNVRSYCINFKMSNNLILKLNMLVAEIFCLSSEYIKFFYIKIW
jgi:hypothetical protein